MRQQTIIPNRKRLKAIKHRSVLGAEPGTLQSCADANGAQLSLVAYNDHEVIEKTINDPDEISDYMRKYPIIWLQVCGLGNVEVLKKITGMFKLNVLAMEDVVNVHQR